VDPVRYVGNRSSGKMGYAVARAAWRRGANVTLVSGPTSLAPPVGVDVVPVQTAVEMYEAVSDLLPGADVSVFSAAVADYRPVAPAEGKLKRGKAGNELALELTANPDIASETRERRRQGSVAVGFALETDDLTANARAKLEAKDFDLLVANEATAEGAGFEVDTNRVTILSPGGGAEELPLMSKDDVAEEILDRVAALLGREA
jgi:phosphopantothenoylcysteine decarboxylase/phosphopantothenate--cysteine ligase